MPFWVPEQVHLICLFEMGAEQELFAICEVLADLGAHCMYLPIRLLICVRHRLQNLFDHHGDAHFVLTIMDEDVCRLEDKASELEVLLSRCPQCTSCVLPLFPHALGCLGFGLPDLCLLTVVLGGSNRF